MSPLLSFFACVPNRQRTLRELELGWNFVRVDDDGSAMRRPGRSTRRSLLANKEDAAARERRQETGVYLFRALLCLFNLRTELFWKDHKRRSNGTDTSMLGEKSSDGGDGSADGDAEERIAVAPSMAAPCTPLASLLAALQG